MLIVDYLKDQGKMTDIEQSISQYFLNHEKALENITVRKMADELYVAPSTIVRFCQKLGYKGYEDFRKKYLEEADYINTHFKEIDPNIPFKETDSDWHIANNIGHLYKETVSDTLGLIHYKTLEDAHTLLEKTEDIYLFSIGDLIEPAHIFKDKMVRIGKKVHVIERADLAYITATQVDESACFILSSYSGETKQTLRIAEYLHHKEIPFIGLTSFGENTLSKLATITLYLSSREKLVNNLGNFSSVLSTMYLLDILYACVLGGDYQKNYNEKIESARNYELYRHSSNPLLND